MRIRHSVQRATISGWSVIRLLANVAFALFSEAAGIRLLPVRQAMTRGSVRFADRASHDRTGIENTSWMVQTVARLVPVGVLSYQQGLTVQRLPRRRRNDARKHSGIGNAELDVLAAQFRGASCGRIVIAEYLEESFAWAAVYQ